MARRRRESISVNVEVDIDDLVEELTDEEIMDMAEQIGHSGSPREVVSRAIVMIRSGRVDDGITELEREFMPSWKSKADCQAKYDQAMAIGGGA